MNKPPCHDLHHKKILLGSIWRLQTSFFKGCRKDCNWY